MRDYSIREFSDLIYDTLKVLKYKQVLTNPRVEDKENELIELHTPLKSVNKTDGNMPIKSTFQMSVTVWATKNRKSMEMTDEVDEKLRKFNLVRTNTSPVIYDAVLQKYGTTVTYEVVYNAIMNTFDIIK